MEPKELREIVDVLASSRWDYASITTADYTLTVGTPPAGVGGEKGGLTTGPASAPPPGAGPELAAGEAVPPSVAAAVSLAPASGPVDGTAISAPSVGVLWRAPKPGAAPFVEVGQQVQQGDTLALLEVMKLFTPITSSVSGTLAHVHVGDGDMVEHGTVIFTVAPAAAP